VDTGSREENASKQEIRASVLIQSEPILLEQVCARDLAAQIAPELCKSLLAPEKQRVQETPGARCTRSLACDVWKAHELVTTGSPEHPAFPAQWF
jgi:hypothetical protein